MGCGCGGGTKPQNRTIKTSSNRYIYNPNTSKQNNMPNRPTRRRTIKRPAR